MLSRRYLRIKVFQQLYSFFICEGANLNKAESELFQSLEKIYDLYLLLLRLLVEIKNTAIQNLETSKTKYFSAPLDANPKFVENRVIRQLEQNSRFINHLEKRKIDWTEKNEFPQKIFLEVKKSPEYSKYILSEENNFKHDKNIVLQICNNHIFNSEHLHQFFEEKNIHWEDDISLACISVFKTIEQMSDGKSAADAILLPLYKSESDDVEFAKNLLRKTASNNEEYEKMIEQKAANWETERMAMVDKILMKMALCELLNFNNIPIKVSLNEYIDISKDYSTPQSKIFINGILDKLVVDLKNSGRIVKEGRGLIE